MLSLIAGILFIISFPHYGGFYLPFTHIGGLTLLFFISPLYKKQTGKQWFLSSVIFLTTITLIGFYWLSYTLKNFGHIPIPFNYLFTLAFTPFSFPQFPIFFIFIYFFKKDLSPLLLSTIFTLIEFLTPVQFPISVGHPFLSLSPYLLPAQYLGPYFYSFISVWISLSLCDYWIKNKKDYLCIITVILTLFFSSFPIIFKTVDTLAIRIVQGNIGNTLKLQSEFGDSFAYKRVIDRYYNLSTKNIGNTQLLIWPETAYPFKIDSTSWKKDPKEAPLNIFNIVKESDSYLLFGGYEINPLEKNNYFYKTTYNSAFFVDTEGKLLQVYQKKKLIPFGETLPFGKFNRFLAPLIDSVSFFERGKDFPIFTIDENKFATAICYDILFTDEVRGFFKKDSLDFIVNLTNDSWYGDTSEPYQHQFLTHWRSIENNLPIIRSTNTGITSVLLPDGSKLGNLPRNTHTYLDLALPLNKRERTIYTKYGQWTLALLVLFLILFETIRNKVMCSQNP